MGWYDGVVRKKRTIHFFYIIVVVFIVRIYGKKMIFMILYYNML
jgi:hypothetical protein